MLLRIAKQPSVSTAALQPPTMTAKHQFSSIEAVDDAMALPAWALYLCIGLV
jgi:hypothetical protein